MSKRDLLYGTLILTIVNFLSRIMGFVYKIAISKHIGAEGVGLFQMISPVLMFTITITTAGIPIAISRLVSVHASNGRSIKKILRISFFTNLVLSVVLSLIVFIFAKTISYNILKNKDIYLSVLFLIPSIIIISLGSIFRGYFYGIKKVLPSGIAQLIEQFSKIVFVLYILTKINTVSPKVGVIICVIGIGVGELLGFLWMIISYKFTSFKETPVKKASLSYSTIFYDIFKVSLPITLSRMLSVILQLLNSILIPQRLVLAGYTYKQSIAIFGKSVGMTLPLIYLPFMVTSPLVVNIIPMLSELVALKKHREVRENIHIALRITFILSIPMTIFFAFFGEPIGLFLYGDKEVGTYLSVIGYGTIFMSLQHVLSGILQGIGKERISTVNNLVGNVFQVICAYFLLAKPNVGINGFFLSFILSALITTLLDYIVVCKNTSIKINLLSYMIKPLIAAIFSLLITRLAYTYIGFLPCVFIGMFMYIFILFIIKGIPKSIFKLIFRIKKS